MKALLWLLGLFVLAVALSLAARFNEAYVLVELLPWRVTLSLNLALLILLFLFVLLYGLLK